MRFDHVAYRVKDRKKTAQFFVDAFGYKIEEEFEIPFEDGKIAKCLVLTPPEKIIGDAPFMIDKLLDNSSEKGMPIKKCFEVFIYFLIGIILSILVFGILFGVPLINLLLATILCGVGLSKYRYTQLTSKKVEYHMAPEIFISDGEGGSIVGDWVESRGGIGGIHHIAYQVDSVEGKMEDMKKLGYYEFTTDKPLLCDGLKQVFTKPSELTGIIYEFIEREKNGFCKENVKELMESTKNI